MSASEPRTYDWARVNVKGDGSCFYRSLYEAAKFHSDLRVLNDLYESFGIEVDAEGSNTSRATQSAKNAKEEEDAFCDIGRTIITNVLRINSGEVLDRLVGGARSPYVVNREYIRFLIEDVFRNIDEFYTNLIDDVVNDKILPADGEELTDTLFRVCMSYFKSTIPGDTKHRIQSGLLRALEALSGEVGSSNSENTAPLTGADVIPYIQEDLRISTLPIYFQNSIQDAWDMYLIEMSATYQKLFGNILYFPRSRGEYAERIACVIGNKNEFTAELDINIINTVLAPRKLIVHTLSTLGPKRVITPEGFRALYVILDSDGEHYNFLVTPTTYETHMKLLEGLAPKSKKVFYTRAELFMPDSLGVEEHPSKPIPVSATTQKRSSAVPATRKAPAKNNNAHIKAQLANMGITENMESYKNMYTAVKAQLEPAATSQGGKRRDTRKKRRA